MRRESANVRLKEASAKCKHGNSLLFRSAKRMLSAVAELGARLGKK